MPSALEDVKKELDSSSPEPQEQETPEEVPEPAAEKPPKGFVPLQALHEEREKRQALEAKLQQLESSVPSDSEVFSDEGKALKGEINSLKSELSEVRTELTRKELIAAHPFLGEKWGEFEAFRSNPENKGMNLRTAAKAFLVENGLLEVSRKGLERPTGGPRVPVSPEMTAEDVDTLRKNDFKKYREMVKKGQIKL